MKTAIAGFLSVSLQLAAAAGENLVTDNADFSQGTKGWTLDAPWSMTSEGGRSNSACAFLEYQAGPQNRAIYRSSPLSLKPKTYYQAAAWCRAATPPGEQAPRLLFYAAHPAPPSLPLLTYATYDAFPFWNKIVHYFNSAESDAANLLFFPQAGTTSTLWVDDVELQQLSEEDLATCLLPNPDFEEGESGVPPCMWRIRDNAAKNSTAAPVTIALDAKAGFITGTQSLRIDGSSLPEGGDRQYGVESVLVPAIPGRRYSFSVWLKAVETDTTVRLIIDGWIQKQEKGQWKTMPHWYRETYVKAAPEWRRFTIEARIPGEDDTTFFLPGRLARVIILLKGRSAVWVDHCRFQQE